jgi:hypothetical protein
LQITRPANSLGGKKCLSLAKNSKDCGELQEENRATAGQQHLLFFFDKIQNLPKNSSHRGTKITENTKERTNLQPSSVSSVYPMPLREPFWDCFSKEQHIQE